MGEFSSPTLFSAASLRAVELQSEDIPELQRFFEANPEYFLAVEGRPPGPSEADLEFRSEPPAGWSYTKKWFLGFIDDANSLVGMASLVSDLLALHVWHIGLFILATARHGSGDAQALYRALEEWAVQSGAQWFRLGVVEGNARAERFWQKAGLVQVRKRNSVAMGERINTVCVMAKPLAGGTLAEYLALVARDRPESSSPKEVVERGYDQVAHRYARLEGETEWPRMRWLRKVLSRLSPGSSLLDLGCGSGVPADVEISQEHRVTGVDISQTQIDLARQNVPTGIFLHGDAGSVQFAASSFDAVVSFYTLEHIPREEHATILRRIHTWLRPGGLLLISMEAGDYKGFFGEWLGVPMFMSCFDPETMRELVTAAGFELLETVIEAQVEQGHAVPYHWLLARKRQRKHTSVTTW